MPWAQLWLADPRDGAAPVVTPSTVPALLAWGRDNADRLARVARGSRAVVVDVPSDVVRGDDPCTRMLLLPLRSAGDSLGAMAVGLAPRLPFDDPYRATLELLADAVSGVVDRARADARARTTSLALQHSLLPRVSERVPGLDVATRYLPGVTDTEVGGDWFDVVSLGSTRVALVLGDVMGRGLRAAAVMGQVRAAARAYAQLDLEPAEVLAQLDRLVESIGDRQAIPEIVTCVYGVYDAAEGTLTWASAGHPPPLLLLPGEGTGTVLEPPPGGPLGLGDAGYGERVLDLPEDAVLALYTDGLVERRGLDLGTSIDAVAALLGPSTRTPEAVADALLGARVADDDDTALLVVRPTRISPLERVEVRPARRHGRAPARARREARVRLAPWGVGDEVLEAALLVISELVTNAVRHGNAPVSMRLLRDVGTVVIEVADSDRRRPRRRAATPEDESGRGMAIVDALVSRWGVRPTAGGKALWAELPLS